MAGDRKLRHIAQQPDVASLNCFTQYNYGTDERFPEAKDYKIFMQK